MALDFPLPIPPLTHPITPPRTGVQGTDLLLLDESELVSLLGISKLQAKKILMKLHEEESSTPAPAEVPETIEAPAGVTFIPYQWGIYIYLNLFGVSLSDWGYNNLVRLPIGIFRSAFIYLV